MKSIVLFASILRIVLIALIVSFAVYANAQSVAVNTNGTVADPSAMPEVSTTSKGFLTTKNDNRTIPGKIRVFVSIK